jgi:hypothetical protein
MLSPLYGQLSPLRVPTKAVRKVSDDADANTYLLAVESADGQELESGVISAVESFITGCKSDSIWSALKASCILAGARTLSGALVPLVGTAPTNNNFVSADYNRKTGLKGNASTKQLNSNRNNGAEPQNSKHLVAFMSQMGSAGLIGAHSSSQILEGSPLVYPRINGATSLTGAYALGLIGASRGSSASVTYRNNGTTTLLSYPSSSPVALNIAVFSRLNASFTSARLSFYSIGENLDLALLDTRVSNLMTALSAAIP